MSHQTEGSNHRNEVGQYFASYRLTKSKQTKCKWADNPIDNQDHLYSFKRRGSKENFASRLLSFSYDEQIFEAGHRKEINHTNPKRRELA